MIFHRLGLILNREAGRGYAPAKTPLPPRLAIQTVIASPLLLVILSVAKNLMALRTGSAKQSNYCFQRLLRHFMPRNDNQTASPKERGIQRVPRKIKDFSGCLQGVRLLHENQRGFTLIELIIAIAITGLITGGVTMTIFQVFNINTLSTNHMIAVRQVQNAGYWVSHDVQIAQSVDTTDDPETPELELVTLTWTEYSIDDDGDVHQVVYTLEDNKLQRSYSVNDGSPTVTFAAEFVDPDNTSCAFDGDVLTLTVTATVGSGSPQEASETRTYEITPRPSV